MDPTFEPSISYASPEDPVWKRAVIKTIEFCTGQPELERKYRLLRNQAPFLAQHFWKDALTSLSVTLDYDRDAIATVPKEDPLVVIANHPFGVLDGLSICYLASQLRPNFQILTNSVLCQDPELDPFLLPVSFEETREAMQINIESKNRALENIRAGGAVVIFPGGGISTATGWFGKVTDLEWKRFAAKIIQMSKATVVPIFFHGQNSRLFQIVSQFSLTLRLALLLWEVKRRMFSSIKITIGEHIPFESIAHIKNRQDLLNHLRQHVYGLGEVK